MITVRVDFDDLEDRASLLDALNALALLDAAGCDTTHSEIAAEAARRVGRDGAGTAPGARRRLCGEGLALERSAGVVSVGEFFKRYAEKWGAEKSCSRALARSLGHLVARRMGAGTPIECLRREDAAAILGRYRSAMSWNSVAARLAAALRWGAREGLCDEGLARCVPPRRAAIYREPVFFAPERVERIMRQCEKHPGPAAGAAGAILALGFFAGVRSVEIWRARWEDLDLTGGVLRIPRPKGWTRGAKPRIVELEKNAAAWLETWRGRETARRSGRAPEGPIVRDPRLFTEWKRRWLDPAGDSWGRGGGRGCAQANVMRHTYATMHVAAFRDAAATALNMGHARGTAVLEKHYRGLVARAVAERYWKIWPAEIENTVETVETTEDDGK
ncbi:MAG: site-specific integrase [Kiritimatiellae bacterium]|nr:site-specific integrase [Kiritimatiellia bacterium]